MSAETRGCQIPSVQQFFSDEVVLGVMRGTTVFVCIFLVVWCVVLWRSARSLKSMTDASCNWLGHRPQRDEVEVDEVEFAIRARRLGMLCAFFVTLSVPLLIDRVVELHVAGVWGSADHDALRTLMFGRATIGVTVGNIIFTLLYVRGSCSNVEMNVLAVLVHVLFFLNKWATDNTFDLMRYAALGGGGS